ncbi:MAG: hypothetical protein HZY74_12290 [Brevundimonas sp.]|nr:MAG: hypothetical protein HZY74_12290 [Brevundimonas sp.]
MSGKLLRVGVIPTGHDDQVRAALAGLPPPPVGGWPTAPRPDGMKPTLLVTAWTPWMTAPSLLQADVILSPDPAGAVTWAEAQGLAQRPHSLALATDWLATAAAMPSTTRLYAPEDLAGGVRLNDELQLAP